MAKPFTEWTVLPHGKLSQLEDNLLSVVGTLHMPMGEFPRRMTVARLRSGKLVIYSAIALDENEMQALEQYGLPSYLVIPNDIHRMDARIWKDRYPSLVVLAPAGARAKIAETVQVDHTHIEFEDSSVQLVTVPGTDEREAALLVHSATGTTLVINDLVWNVGDRKGMGGWVMKAMGMTGDEPKIPAVVEHRTIKHKDALRAQFEEWSKLQNLRRIIVSHGKMVTDNPSEVLMHLASDLAA